MTGFKATPSPATPNVNPATASPSATPVQYMGTAGTGRVQGAVCAMGMGLGSVIILGVGLGYV